MDYELLTEAEQGGYNTKGSTPKEGLSNGHKDGKFQVV